MNYDCYRGRTEEFKIDEGERLWDNRELLMHATYATDWMVQVNRMQAQTGTRFLGAKMPFFQTNQIP